jgi:hypothetical protein
MRRRELATDQHLCEPAEMWPAVDVLGNPLVPPTNNAAERALLICDQAKTLVLHPLKRGWNYQADLLNGCETTKGLARVAHRLHPWRYGWIGHLQ